MKDICFTAPALLSEIECADFISRGEGGLYKSMAFDYPASYRNNDRLIDDRPDLAEALFSRIRALLPNRVQARGQEWVLVGLNPRFRGCRYRNGQSFRRHRDGAFSPQPGVESFLTLMLYLNDEAEFQGGATRFYADRFVAQPDFEVRPKAGLGIVFSHAFWHDGEHVTSGTKYVLRTDVLYRATSSVQTGHRGYIWCVNGLPDGRFLTGSRDKSIGLWDNQGSLVSLFESAHKSSVACLEGRDDLIWSGGRDRHVNAWRLSRNTLQKINGWLAHEGAVLTLKDWNGAHIISGGADNRVKLWSESGACLATASVDGWPWALCPLDSRRLAVGTETGVLSLFEEKLQRHQTLLELKTPILALHKTTEADLLLGCGDGKVRRLDSSLTLKDEWKAHRGPVTAVGSLSDGRIVTGGEDDGVRLWKNGSSETLCCHDDFVRGIQVTPHDTVVSASYDGSLQFSRPSAILRTEVAANPGGARSGTAAAS